MTAPTQTRQAASFAVVLGATARIVLDDGRALLDAYLAHTLNHQGSNAPSHPSARQLRERYLPDWTRRRMAAAHRELLDAGLIRFTGATHEHPGHVTVTVPTVPDRPASTPVTAPVAGPLRLTASRFGDEVVLRVIVDETGHPDARQLLADLDALGALDPDDGALRLDVGAATWPHPFIVHDLTAAYRAGRIPWPSITSRREDVRRVWRDALERAR